MYEIEKEKKRKTDIRMRNDHNANVKSAILRLHAKQNERKKEESNGKMLFK